MAERSKPLIIAGAIAFAVSLAICVLRLDRVAGMIVDDAWYVLLAKALATGQGYTLINSPTPGIVPFYPPGFPALLSILYRIGPGFPANVWLLKSVSIAALLGAGCLAFAYFGRVRGLPVWVAFALGFATAIYPALVFLATSSVMSECVFLFLQLAAIFVLERSVGRGAAAASAALASLAFLTRPAGLGLLLGAAIFLVKERRFRQAIAFTAVAAVLVGPWLLYSREHAPTAEQRVEQGGSIVLPYTAQLWQRVAGRPLSGTIGAADLPARVWQNLNEIAAVDVGAFVFYPLYRPVEPNETKQIADATIYASYFFTLVALVGYVAALRERLSLAEIVLPLGMSVSLLWGWEQYRLLLPLLPFFFHYLVLGVRAIARLARASERSELLSLLAVSWLFVASALASHCEYLERLRNPVPERGSQWIRAFEENEAFIRYIAESIPKNALIATDNPALLHLYTGHRTIASSNPAARWRAWNRLGVRYYATLSPYPLDPDPNESPYRVLHRSAGFLELRLLDLGPPDARPVWGER